MLINLRISWQFIDYCAIKNTFREGFLWEKGMRRHRLSIVSLLIVSSAHTHTTSRWGNVLSWQFKHCFMTICQRISQLSELFEHKTSHRSAAGINSGGQCSTRVCVRFTGTKRIGYTGWGRGTKALPDRPDLAHPKALLLPPLLLCLHHSLPLWLFVQSERINSITQLSKGRKSGRTSTAYWEHSCQNSAKLLPLTRWLKTLTTAEIKNNFKLCKTFKIINL